MGQGLALVEPKVPNGSFETLKRDRAGWSRTSQLGRLKKVGQGLALVEPKVPNGSFENLRETWPGRLE